MPSTIIPSVPKPGDKLPEIVKWGQDFGKAVSEFSRRIFTKVNALYDNRYPKIGPVFANGDTTPSVKEFSVFKTNNAAPTTITDFDDANPEHLITVIAGDANTTIAHNANIKLLKGANMALAADKTASFIVYGGVWYQVGGQDA